MDTRKLPPALLIALGLAGCGDDGSEMEASACLSFPPTDGTTELTACLNASQISSDSSDEGSSVGPCLEVGTTGPNTSATGTGSDSGSGSSSDDGGTTLGPCLDAPLPTTGGANDEEDRADVLRSVLDRLPKDVAAKFAKG